MNINKLCPIMNKIALNLPKNEKSAKQGVNGKRFKAE